MFLLLGGLSQSTELLSEQDTSTGENTETLSNIEHGLKWKELFWVLLCEFLQLTP